MPSALIRSYVYDPAGATLTITFVSGRAYAYAGVPEDVAEGLRPAFAKGEYFNSSSMTVVVGRGFHAVLLVEFPCRPWPPRIGWGWRSFASVGQQAQGVDRVERLRAAANLHDRQGWVGRTLPISSGIQ